MQSLRSIGGVARDTAADLSVLVTTARSAWLRGDFSACIDALEPLALRTGDTPERAEGMLLLARALLRSQRPLDAKELLEPALATFGTVDGECTAWMLHGAAVARCGTAAEGLALLRAVAERAAELGAHRAIRTEIAYYRALAHWSVRELEAAEAEARVAENERLDVLSVRATQLLGFVAVARGQYGDALETFRAALDAYRSCRERDGDLIEQILVQVATLEAQLRGGSVAESYRTPSLRRVPGDAFRPGASVARCQVASVDAWQYALDGDAQAALRCMRAVVSAAPTEPWKVFGLAGRASVSAAFGETENARDHAMHAVEIAQRIDWQATHGEERFALVLLAEALAPLDPQEAARVLARFDAVTSKLDDLQFARTDPRKTALQSYVRGLVARRTGRDSQARTLLDDAYRGFRDCGYLWRAALALVELDATSAPAAERGDFHLEAAALLVREHFPNSFLARRLGRWSGVYGDPLAARLTPAQRQVLRYALDGYGAKEIASATGRSVKTIGNQLASLHEAFGVNSTLRLVAECHRRGFGSPIWHETQQPAVATGRTAHRIAG
jgi:DNA-binding CsgD family transcriptional regulator